MPITAEDLYDVLSRHGEVPGVSIGLIHNYKVSVDERHVVVGEIVEEITELAP